MPGIIVLKDHQPAGPFTRVQVHEALGRGEFTLRHLAHLPGMKEWRPLGEILHELDDAKGPVARSLPPVPSLASPPALAPVPPALAPRPPRLQTPPEIGPPRLVQPPSLPQDKPEAVPESPTARRAVLAPPLPGWMGSPASALRPAPFFHRFQAWLVDCAILFVPIVALFGLLYVGTSLRSLLEHWNAEDLRQARLLLWQDIRELTIWMVLGFSWIYAAGLESSRWQGTVGKQWMGLIVVDAAGHRPTFLRASGRHAAKYLSAICAFLGFIVAAFTRGGLAWHDRLSATQVVQRPAR